IDGLEGIVLEEFLADFIPEVFLWIELWRVGWQEEQRDVGGNREVSATMVGSAIENQQDVLPGKPSRQEVEGGLEARRIRRRHDQVDAHPVLRRDCTVQIDARMSCEVTSGRMPAGAQQGRGRFIRPKRASSVNMIRRRRPRWAAARLAFLTALGKP